jgi:hypothetical protein
MLLFYQMHTLGIIFSVTAKSVHYIYKVIGAKYSSLKVKRAGYLASACCGWQPQVEARAVGGHGRAALQRRRETAVRTAAASTRVFLL